MIRKQRCRGERMKHNLKGLKKCFKDHKGHNALACLAYGIENMEKELRERQKGYYQSSKWISIKEVLGE